MSVDNPSTLEYLERLYRSTQSSREWVKRAACRGMGPQKFYLPSGHATKADPARKVCSTCPVRQECLDYAVTNNEKFGIWGGLTRSQRLLYKRKKRRSSSSSVSRSSGKTINKSASHKKSYKPSGLGSTEKLQPSLSDMDMEN